MSDHDGPLEALEFMIRMDYRLGCHKAAEGYDETVGGPLGRGDPDA